MNKQAVQQSRYWWEQGAIDAFNRRPPRSDPADALAYLSGRVEGEAWRDDNFDLDQMLIRNRIPA